MAERPRPPRQRQPSFFLDEYNYNQATGGAGLDDDSSPPGSSGGHSGGHSSADLYRTVAPPGAGPIPRHQPNYSTGSSKQLPPPPVGHAQQGSVSMARSTAVAGPFGEDNGTTSPRSSYSDDQHLHLRNAPTAREPRIEGLPASHPGYAGSLQGGHPGYVPGGQHYASSERERDSFFAPPVMPWMRNEGSAPPSRSESPSFFGAARTSSASPMPYFPQHTPSAFSHTSTYAGGPGATSRPRKAFVSNLLTGPVDKPWLGKKDRIAQASWWVTVILWLSGAAGAAVLCFFAYRDVPKIGNLCKAFQDEFATSTIDTTKWFKEVGVSGFGNGGFEWTTPGDTNAYIKNGQLYIFPTLTEETGGLSRAQILDGTNQQIDGCTNSAPDSNDYYRDKPLGTAAGLKRRAAPSLLERTLGLVRRQGGNGGGNAGNGGGNTGNGGGNTGNGGGNTGNGGGNTGNGGGNTGNGGGNAGNGGGNTGNGGGNTGGNGGGNTGGNGGGGNTGTGTGGGNTGGNGGGANGVTGGGVPGGGGGNAANGQHDPCNIVSSKAAQQAVNPVQSARLVTRNNAQGSIKYGRVEIRAKMPTGDWLFPQMIMLPKATTYGRWPLSGEIDLVMGRGNDANYKGGGRDFITSGLQWGPTVGFNAFDRTRGWYQQRRTNFNQAFHTFTLEWTDKFLWIFVDRRVNRVINLDFKKQSFFQRGKFPLTFQNGTDEALVPNPWRNGPNVAPFDQEFYLVLTVQAGGTSGWFQDRVGNKPWFDRSATAMFDFANATDTWKTTWPKSDAQRAMIVDYVRMETLCSK